MKFHLAKHDHFLILTHPDYGFEVAVNGNLHSLDDAKKLALSKFAEDVTEEKINYLKQNSDKLDYYDEVWMDGALHRIDYSQGSKEGQEIVVRMKAEFPDETIYDDSKPKNVISQYTSARVDYPNEIFNYYNFREPTGEEKTRFGLHIYDYLDAFGIDFSSMPAAAVYGDGVFRNLMGMTKDDINSWFAFKFDRTTKEVKCKIVLPKSQIPNSILEEIRVELPDEFTVPNSTFFARLHNADKSVSPEIDVYFRTTGYVVHEFCNETGLNYPYGDYKTSKDLEDKTFVWGLIYNADTKKFKHIKGYARHFR